MSARLPAILLAAALLAGCAATDRGAAPENPATLDSRESFSDSRTRVGRVIRVEQGEHADWVLLDAGYERNVRTGMNITVRRQGKAIASLVVAETTARTAAALILDLTPNQTVQAGDSAHITTN